MLSPAQKNSYAVCKRMPLRVTRPAKAGAYGIDATVGAGFSRSRSRGELLSEGLFLLINEFVHSARVVVLCRPQSAQRIFGLRRYRAADRRGDGKLIDRFVAGPPNVFLETPTFGCKFIDCR